MESGSGAAGWIKLGLAAGLMLVSSATWAGRPFTTEDAGVIDARNCELEAFGSHARAQSDPSERGAWAQVGCGIGFFVELRTTTCEPP